MKVKLDLSNYGIKADLINDTGVDTSKVAKKVDLSNLKSEVDKLDIDKSKKCTKWFKQFKGEIKKFTISNFCSKAF